MAEALSVRCEVGMGEKRRALHIDPGLNQRPREPEATVVPRPHDLDLERYVQGVRGRDRVVLGRALTLIESGRPEHQELAHQLLLRLQPHTGQSIRIGITGIPGVGKSTFIDVLGFQLTGQGLSVAVLAVDPSSGLSGGSILGDKTRMARLAQDGRAFIRPSPSAGTLGGVARKTRESMLVCEAAGYDVVLVETVGVGQSEVTVAEMTDLFVALLLAGAGDELQGIKRGLLELVDFLAVNKADGENLEPAQRAAREYESALAYMTHADPDWRVPVLVCSAKEARGVDELWNQLRKRHDAMRESGSLHRKREQQQLRWMWSLVEDGLHERLSHAPAVRRQIEELEGEVRAGRIPASTAARRILRAFLG